MAKKTQKKEKIIAKDKPIAKENASEAPAAEVAKELKETPAFPDGETASEITDPAAVATLEKAAKFDEKEKEKESFLAKVEGAVKGIVGKKEKGFIPDESGHLVKRDDYLIARFGTVNVAKVRAEICKDNFTKTVRELLRNLEDKGIEHDRTAIRQNWLNICAQKEARGK